MEALFIAAALERIQLFLFNAIIHILIFMFITSVSILKGAVDHGDYFFPKKFEFVSLCSFICLQAVYQLSGPVCKATWNGCPCILLLTFISRFVIDFLSIRKVIIFSAIATDDRHPLRSRSIHQNAANCMTIRFCYIAQPRGYGKPTAHAHVMMFDALPVGRTACRVRR